MVNLRVYLDLERGWRITMPNLEQAGLLTIGYLGLDGVAGAARTLWRADRARAAHARRRKPASEICTVLLDEMRRSLAIDVECFDDDEFDRIKRAQPGVAARRVGGRRRATSPEAATVLRPARPARQRPRAGEHVRPRQVRPLPQAPHRFPGYLQVITSDDAQQIIDDLLEVLASRAAWSPRSQHPLPARRPHGYRVRAAALIWRPGDGTHGADDPLSRTFTGAERPRVNPYFVRLYRDVAGDAGRAGGPRAHRPGRPGGPRGARGGVPRRPS